MFSDVFRPSKNQGVKVATVEAKAVSETSGYFRMLNRLKVSRGIARYLKVPKYSRFSSEFNECGRP